jgi:predicted transcriptional regulator
MPKSRSREETRKMIWEMIKNKAKTQIYNAFRMYGRLSLTELAEKLHKSKSTIHTHLNFLLELGIITKERVPLDSNPNVYENHYELSENAGEVFRAIDMEFKPFKKLTKEQIQQMIEPAISMNRLLKSYFETQIKYFKAIRDSGFDDEAIEDFNKVISWVNDNEGNPVILSRNTNSFAFYAEKEYFKEMERIFELEMYKDLDWDEIFSDQEIAPEEGQLEKPMLIIKSTIPYGYILEYLNKQKKKSYQN